MSNGARFSSPTWRTLYFVTAGASALGIILGFFCIDKDLPSHEEDRRVDWIGALLVTSGLVLIVFVLSDSPTAPSGWKTDCQYISLRYAAPRLTKT